MDRTKSFVLFLLFLLCFYAALTLKFQFLTIDQDESAQTYVFLACGVLLGGIFFGLCLQTFLGTRALWRSLLEGISIAGLLFVSVSIAEDTLSERNFMLKHKPEDFSALSGHCGITVGRTVLKWIHSEEQIPGALSEFKLDQQCRLSHLEFVMRFSGSFCEGSEDKIDCLIRWMSSMAEHGYWNHATRKFFFEQVLKAWPNSKKEEALVSYALKDLDLDAGRQGILRQIGISESLSERYLILQDKDELDHLELTKQIFETVEPKLNEARIIPPPPYVFKFKDTENELQTKLSRIPELQQEIKQLSSKSTSL